MSTLHSRVHAHPIQNEGAVLLNLTDFQLTLISRALAKGAAPKVGPKTNDVISFLILQSY